MTYSEREREFPFAKNEYFSNLQDLSKCLSTLADIYVYRPVQKKLCLSSTFFSYCLPLPSTQTTLRTYVSAPL